MRGVVETRRFELAFHPGNPTRKVRLRAWEID